MALTAAQLAALRTDILNTPALNSQPQNGDGAQAIADVYNATAAPDYWVWRSLVPESELYEVTTPAPDNTSWSWSTYIAQSQAERDSWRQMVSMRGGLKPNLANVRAAVGQIFSGAGAGPVAQRAHLLVVSRRRATVAEKLFATATAGGVGQRGSSGNPDLMAFEGSVSFQDVLNARAS